MRPLFRVLPFVFLIACGMPTGDNALKEAWDGINRPERLGAGYEFKLDHLPNNGQHQGPQWSGDYWPSQMGGISQRWNADGGNKEKVTYALLDRNHLSRVDSAQLSPAEKYDIFAGDYSFSLTQHERKRTGALDALAGTIPAIPGWEGLCHGWAPASIEFEEPQAVELTNADGVKVSFGSADIKALLSFAMHEGLGSREQFLGRRCEADFGRLQTELNAGRITGEQYATQVPSLSCRDSNAGSFHVVLANELGRRRQSFLMDMTRDIQVWNQAIVSYQSRVGAVRQQTSPNAAANTAYEVDVETALTYIAEVASAWNAQGPQYPPMLKSILYRYRLELNAAREIIGGQWLSDEHPDFLWRKSRPVVSERLRKLPEIYKASTGKDFLPEGTSLETLPEPNPVESENPANPWTKPNTDTNSSMTPGTNPWTDHS